MAKNLYTSMADLLISVKGNLMAESKLGNTALGKVKTWNVGFVFPQTVYPAVTVFPLTKTFGGIGSDGSLIVDYRMSVDIYSARNEKLEDSKSYVMEAAAEVKEAVKKHIGMVDKSGVQHSFRTVVERQVFHESEDAKKRGLTSSASLEIACSAYHQMDEDRIDYSKILEQDYDSFLDNLCSRLKSEAKKRKVQVGSWSVKVAKPSIQYPFVMILPDDEVVMERKTNQVVVLSRPVRIHVVSSGIPTWALLKSNMALADDLLAMQEAHYMLGGYSQDFKVTSIQYVPNEGGMMFMSVINSEYQSRTNLTLSYS